MNKVSIYILSLIVLFFFSGCSNHPDLPTVEYVNLERYTGKWYEIARFPHSFEKDLQCVTAEYTILDDGNIEVLNSGVKVSDGHKKKTAKGKAWLPNPNDSSKLKVQFFWPFSADYYIMKLDEEYNYVLIGNPSREYLWILSRQTTLDQKIIDDLLFYATNQGYDVSKIEYIKHDCM